MNSIERILLAPATAAFSSIVVRRINFTKVGSVGEKTAACKKKVEPILFGKKKVGELEVYAEKFHAADDFILQELAACLAPILNMPGFDLALKLLQWVLDARAIAPEFCNWTGIYFKESFLLNLKNDFLVLGPFLGESTEHIRIPLNSGFCGLALSEERIVNVPDVSLDSRHIACSLKTRSEIVIPLKAKNGLFVAELDIDSHSPAAFTPQIETRLTSFAETFADIL